MKKIVKINFAPDRTFMNMGIQCGTLSTLITMATDGLSKKITSRPLSHRLAGYAAGFGFSVLTGYIFGVVTNSGIETVFEPGDKEVRYLTGMNVSDRYTGTYSGGKWSFWPDDGNVPAQIAEDDVTCARAWGLLRKLREDGRICFGVGDSWDEAEADSATWRTRHVKNGTTSYISKEEFDTLFVEKYGETEEAVPEMKSHFYGGDELPVGEFTGGEPIPSVGNASEEDWDE